MSNRDWLVDVNSTRFNDVMTKCVEESIFTNDRVSEFKRGIIQINDVEYMNGSN